MASIQDAIKRLIYKFSSEGADKVAADHNKVADANANLAVKSQATEKASLSLDKAFANLERRFDSTIRAQQDYEKVQAKVNAAVAQNPELQERANNVLAKAAEHFDKAKGTAGALNQVLEAGRGAALGYAAGIGPIGAVLGSFGPWGVAAAAGIGLVTNALAYMRENAEKIGDQSSGLRQFADTTGLTISQVRGLNDAGGSLGVSAETMSSAIQKFTLNLGDARKGSGDLYDQLRIIDKQLAEDISNTRDGAQALDILAKAYNSTADATTKAAIAKAAFGKGGAGVGPVLGTLEEEGGVNKYSADVAKALGVTDQWTQKVAELRNENKSLADDLKLIEASFYTQAMLERQNQALKTQIAIAKAAREAASLPGGSTSQQRNPFVQETNRFAGYEKPFAVGGDPVVDSGGGATAAVEAETDATESLTQAKIDNLNATIKMAAESANLVSALGSSATAAEKEQARIDALTVAFESGKISAENYARALDANPAVNAANLATQAMREQNAILQAGIGLQGTAQMAAQGKVAAEQTYFKVLQDTGSQQAALNSMAAVEESTRTKIADTVDKQHQAMAKVVQASQDNVDKIKAQGTGMEGVVDASIAYRNAIEGGATAMQANVIAANTLEASMLRASQAAQQVAQSATDAANGTQNGILTPQSAMSLGGGLSGKPSDFAPGTMTQSGQFSLHSALGSGVQGNGWGISVGPAIVEKSSAQAASLTSLGTANNILSQGGGLDDVLSAMRTQQFSDGPDISTVGSLYDLKNSQTNDVSVKRANLQEEMAWLQTLPETIARDQSIISLQQAIDQLTNATDANTAATSATLNPLYSQGHGALAIGYYKAAGGLDLMAQGPTSGDQVPFHAMVNGGERITITPPGKSSNDNSRQVINNNNFVFNNTSTSNARRSQRQFAQGFGQMAAAGS